MDAGTLQALELIGWVVLMYWLLTTIKSTRHTSGDAQDQSQEAGAKERSPDK
jgi:hypothetical protein